MNWRASNDNTDLLRRCYHRRGGDVKIGYKMPHYSNGRGLNNIYTKGSFEEIKIIGGFVDGEEDMSQYMSNYHTTLHYTMEVKKNEKVSSYRWAV